MNRKNTDWHDTTFVIDSEDVARPRTRRYPKSYELTDNGHDMESIECPSVWDGPWIMEEDINEGAKNNPYNLRRRKNEKILDPSLGASWLQDSKFHNETVEGPGDTTFVIVEKREKKIKGGMKNHQNQTSGTKRKAQKN
ncbi:uncharacterized protein [Anabrus simplex]|uniref:uncharacterized protein n=1 Tax=Anabrus simplex TaxID=316456 RepID=UPI0035A3C985